MRTVQPEMKEALRRLVEMAEAQQGYFTAKQAKEAGFAEQNHPYHVQARNWTREIRGIYRLAYFPRTDEEDYVRWSLWSRNRGDEPEGVFSHQTALAIHDLTDLIPAKIHLTVPMRFRRNSEIPPILVLHRGRLNQREVEGRRGYRVTRPLQTAIDLFAESEVPMDIVKQAIQQGLQRGMITQREIEEAEVQRVLEPKWEALRREVTGGRP